MYWYVLYMYLLQAPGLLQVLQRTVARPDDIFFVNFGRWHFTNCRGLEEEPYRRALQQLGQLYEVRAADVAENILLRRRCTTK
jgi:hypothetical protein